MMKVGEVKMKRKVNVIEDLDGKKTVFQREAGNEMG